MKKIRKNAEKVKNARRRSSAAGRYEVHFDAHKLDILNFFVGLLIVLIIMYVIFAYCIGISRVTGVSMEPTLKNEQLVMYTKIHTEPEKGDIVAITMPAGEHYIKRVIAGPGDTVNISGGRVTVNGKTPASEKYYAHGTTTYAASEMTFPMTIGKGMYFVMGDNRESSVDSRTFGPIQLSQIDGVILGN
jgi:signal peptidase I